MQKVQLLSFLPSAFSSWIGQSILYPGSSADSTFTTQSPPPFVDVGGLCQAPWGPTEKGASRKRQWWESTQIVWEELGYLSAAELEILLGAIVITEVNLNMHHSSKLL